MIPLSTPKFLYESYKNIDLNKLTYWCDHCNMVLKPRTRNKVHFNGQINCATYAQYSNYCSFIMLK